MVDRIRRDTVSYLPVTVEDACSFLFVQRIITVITITVNYNVQLTINLFDLFVQRNITVLQPSGEWVARRLIRSITKANG